MKSNNKVEMDGKDGEEKMPPLKDADDICVEYLVEGEALMVRRALNMHVKMDDLEGQRKNIFHTRCHIHNKVCNLIINCGSYTNIVSIELVSESE